METKKYDYIDAMRGIAICMVAVVHTSQSILRLDPLAKMITAYSQLGVQLFFVASALTLCLSFYSRTGEASPVRDFFVRRFFRIAPMYYAGILLYTVLMHPAVGFIRPGAGTSGDVVANFFLIHGLVPSANNSVVPGGWSIGTEVIFYALFPLLALLLTNLARTFLFIIFVALFNIAIHWGASQVNGEMLLIENNSFGYFFILNQLTAFGCGILAFHVIRNGSLRGANWKHPARMFALSLALFLLVIGVWESPTLSPISFGIIPLLSGLSFLVLGLALRNIQGAFPPLLLDIGKKSFSMYVLHFIIAWGLVSRIDPRILNKFPSCPSVLRLGCFLVLTLATSYILARMTYRWIESPGIRLGKELLKHRPLPVAPTGAGMPEEVTVRVKEPVA